MTRPRHPMELRFHDTLAIDPRITAAYLLGSAVSGRLRPDSDIDLAVLLSADLSEKLKRMTGFRNVAVHEYSHPT